MVIDLGKLLSYVQIEKLAMHFVTNIGKKHKNISILSENSENFFNRALLPHVATLYSGITTL